MKRNSIFDTIKYQLVKNHLARVEEYKKGIRDDKQMTPEVLNLFYYPERQIRYLVREDVFKIDHVERHKENGQMIYQIYYKNFNQIADFVENAIEREDKRTYVVDEGIKTRKEIDRINNTYRYDNEPRNLDLKKIYEKLDIMNNATLEALICTKFGYGSYQEILDAGIKIEDLIKELGDIEQVEREAEELKIPEYSY